MLEAEKLFMMKETIAFIAKRKGGQEKLNKIGPATDRGTYIEFTYI